MSSISLVRRARSAGRCRCETGNGDDNHARKAGRHVASFGEYASRWCVVGGAVAALFMAVRRLDYFWIANVIYLGFVLWAVVGSVLRLVAYRRGL
jgi:hypothetical protein